MDGGQLKATIFQHKYCNKKMHQKPKYQILTIVQISFSLIPSILSSSMTSKHGQGDCFRDLFYMTTYQKMISSYIKINTG